MDSAYSRRGGGVPQDGCRIYEPVVHAIPAISKADFKSKSYIALKEARESLYWIDLLHRNGYLDDNSIVVFTLTVRNWLRYLHIAARS